MPADVRHIERVAQVAIVIDSDGETTTSPVDVDAVRRTAIPDAGVPGGIG